MPLVQLIIILCCIGAALWAANKYIPMQQTIKTIMNVAVIIGTCLWLLSVFGIIGNLNAIHVGK